MLARSLSPPQVYVSKRALDSSPALQLSDKINIRLHKVAQALGCGCVSSRGVDTSELADVKGSDDWHTWTVASCSKISEDSLLIRLVASADMANGAGKAPTETEQARQAIASVAASADTSQVILSSCCTIKPLLPLPRTHPRSRIQSCLCSARSHVRQRSFFLVPCSHFRMHGVFAEMGGRREQGRGG